ncbi:conserved hypothetical protein [Mesorhizobium ventifaucium]|uniref:Uncharacterized protein n=1 Tax=Mesorhizobium ventifaucium TaxID=666020 RepID=A0ABN8JE20_9HYPH|nr:conserved hypothetical protein [Mesorhizobium ventifaucium]
MGGKLPHSRFNLNDRIARQEPTFQLNYWALETSHTDWP